MRKKSYEEQAIQFAMSESPERVQSVLTTMRAILAQRSPKPMKVRKPGTIPGVPGTVKPAQEKGAHNE